MTSSSVPSSTLSSDAGPALGPPTIPVASTAESELHDKYPMADPLADSYDFLHSLPSKRKHALKEIDREYPRRRAAILAELKVQLYGHAEPVLVTEAQHTADKIAIIRDLQRARAAAAGDAEQIARAKKEAVAQTHELYVQRVRGIIQDTRPNEADYMAKDEVYRWRIAAVAWVEGESRKRRDGKKVDKADDGDKTDQVDKVDERDKEGEADKEGEGA